MQTLADYRKAASLTQCQVAEKLNITQSAVSQWERGDSRPDIGLLSEIARHYNVTEGEIIAAITAAKQDSA